MSVLIEALSLVVPRRALDVSWPGGTDAFLHAMCEPDCASRRVCADDSLASISFFNPEDALPTEERLEELGLLGVVDDAFHDFAFIDQRTGPTMPCAWLHWRQHPDGFTHAWIEGSDSSTMAAPTDWTPEQSRRLVREDIRDDTERMFRLSDDGKFEIWLDFQTGEMSRGLAQPEPETIVAPRKREQRATAVHASVADGDRPCRSRPPMSLDKIIAELERELADTRDEAQTNPAPPSSSSTATSRVMNHSSPDQRSADRRSKIRGCLLGGALGDALGWPVEFSSLASIRARYGPRGIEVLDPDAKGGLGAITDDTQMTLFTAEGVLRSTVRHVERNAVTTPTRDHWQGKHFPHPDLMWNSYRRWLETQASASDGIFAQKYSTDADRGWLLTVPGLHARRAPGTTCVTALATGVQGTPSEPRNDSKGCGGVMRVAPIGLVPCDDPFAYAVMAAALTHGHPSGYLSAGAYAQMLHEMLFNDASLDIALDRAMARLAREPRHEETTRALERARALAAQSGAPTAERVESLGGGWVGEEALAIGVYCALATDGDFVRGVRLAVNHSGDSDSTGSITGALLGVQCGEAGLPSAWLTSLELCDVITRVADDLATGYGGDDAWRARYPGC